MKSLLLSLGYLWLRTLRIRWLSPDTIPTQAIFLLWHEHLPIGIRVFQNRDIHVLISKSSDGNLAAKACAHFGYRVHRGSTSQGGAAGMRALARQMQSDPALTRHQNSTGDRLLTGNRPLAGHQLLAGYQLLAGNRLLAGMALDGPRGPRHTIKPGALWLSQYSGIPVVPVSFRASLAFRLKSWDRCLIPWPFSVVEVRLGKPFHPENGNQIKAAMHAVEHSISSADIYIHVPQPA